MLTGSETVTNNHIYQQVVSGGAVIDVVNQTLDYVPGTSILAVFINTAGNIKFDANGATGVTIAVSAGYMPFSAGIQVSKIYTSGTTAVIGFAQR